MKGYDIDIGEWEDFAMTSQGYILKATIRKCEMKTTRKINSIVLRVDDGNTGWAGYFIVIYPERRKKSLWEKMRDGPHFAHLSDAKIEGERAITEYIEEITTGKRNWWSGRRYDEDE